MRPGKNIISWLPPIAAIGGVIAAVGFTASRQMRSAQGIEQVRKLGINLSEVAARAVSGILSPQQARAIETQRDELERRYEDAGKPAILQAQLVEAATAAGLVVREIQPILGGGPDTSAGRTGSVVMPIYRVSLEGGYQQIATYMDNCRHLRLPARVISMHMEPSKLRDADEKKLLWAELSLEIFQPPPESQPKAQEAQK